ncbi:hypothetical protein MP228_007827 [Amoeboaphelidium protococcarum]|nr:hypothetical protein MP228_007827 [Amoeboaphelidium protococcarum]
MSENSLDARDSTADLLATGSQQSASVGWRPLEQLSSSTQNLHVQSHRPSISSQQTATTATGQDGGGGVMKPPRRHTNRPVSAVYSNADTVLEMQDLGQNGNREKLEVSMPKSPLLSAQIDQDAYRKADQPKRIGCHTFQLPQSRDVRKAQEPAYRESDEFSSCYYTPIVHDPEDFSVPEFKYTMRQCMMQRRTELLIAITMYNESDEFLIRTLDGVLANIRYIYDLYRNNRSVAAVNMMKDPLGSTFISPQTSSATNAAVVRGDVVWRDDPWQKIVLMIISDGRQKCHQRVLEMLQLMGAYHPDSVITKRADPTDDNQVKDVTCHLFETTTMAVIDQDMYMKGYQKRTVPIQIVFALKEKNQKKLNSHKWLFRSFAPMLNPFACILIDVGTRPKTDDSIYNLWKAFDRNLTVAGACGEITVLMGRGGEYACNLLNPLVAAQNFEYKMSNILDKTLESCFGYISVLPGAFSAYRWEALQDIDADEGPLFSYFKGEDPRGVAAQKGNVFESNMYLAEDRILCLELVAKRNSQWILTYIKDAIAETDVPPTAHEFISQRRRWNNGSMFCSAYAIFNLGRFYSTNHSIMRKLCLTFEMFYSFINLLFGWFGIGNFYLSFYLLTQQTFRQQYVIVFELLRYAYWAVIISIFVCGLGNRPQGAKVIYIGSMVVFALVMCYLLTISVLLIIQAWPTSGTSWIVNGGTSRDIVLAVASTYGVYFLSSLMYGELIHIVTCIIQYLLLLPSYINTVSVYAYCNINDISWGTKGATEMSTTEKKKITQEIMNIDQHECMAPPAVSQNTLDDNYKQIATKFAVRPPKQHIPRDANSKKEDYYKNFRTWLVLAWILSNGLLIAIISSPLVTNDLAGGGANQQNPYVAFLMYFIAVQSLVRLCGCIVYLINRKRRGF